MPWMKMSTTNRTSRTWIDWAQLCGSCSPLIILSMAATLLSGIRVRIREENRQPAGDARAQLSLSLVLSAVKNAMTVSCGAINYMRQSRIPILAPKHCRVKHRHIGEEISQKKTVDDPRLTPV